MIKLSRLAVTVAVVASAVIALRASSTRLCSGFLPENTMRIPVSPFHVSSGLDEATFNRVLDRVQAIYGPEVAAHGGQLAIDRRWSDPTVNAYANRAFWGNTWTIHMFGGLARHPAMTEEGFALVACHELGHHLGGAPKLSGLMARYLRMGAWATNEGGADYFATLKCMRRVVPSTQSTIDAYAEQACAASFPDGPGRDACRVGAAAGQSVAFVFQSLRKSDTAPRFDTPDASIVSAMNDDHPEPQCRLDTYFNGALCPKPVGEQVSDNDPNPGACTRLQGYQVGLRPLCWYKPPVNEPMGPSLVDHLTPQDSRRLGERLQSLGSALQGLR